MLWNRLVVIATIIALMTVGFLGYLVYTQGYNINLQNRTITDHSALINELTGKFEIISADITEHRAYFDETLSHLDKEFSTLQDESAIRFISLEEKVKVNEAAIAAGSTQISNLETSLNNLTSKVDAFVPGLAADRIYAETSGSIVQVTDGEYIYGAGFLYDASGHVVTAAHIVKNISDIVVILSDGTISKATVVGTAGRSDVAVLRLEVDTALAPVTMAEANSLAVGDAVVAIGHPFGYFDSLVTGITSHLHRTEVIDSGEDAYWLTDLIQFDAAINPGNSGGPLIDANGKVVGMTVSGISAAYGEGISLAVSTARIINVVANIIDKGVSVYPTIGIYAYSLTPSHALSLGESTTAGAFVSDTVQGSAAAPSGLKANDIILTADGTTLNNASELASYLGSLPNSTDTIRLEIKRGDEKLTLMVLLTHVDETEFWVSNPNYDGLSI